VSQIMLVPYALTTRAQDGATLQGYGLRMHHPKWATPRDQFGHGKRNWPTFGVCTVEVVGETHYPTQLQSPRFAVGQPVVLHRDDGNRYDPGRAVAVLDATGRVKTGHIGSNECVLVRELLDEGVQARVSWEWRLLPENRRVSLRLMLFHPQAVQPPNIPPHWPPACGKPSLLRRLAGRA
jgi:hypothetical protein